MIVFIIVLIILFILYRIVKSSRKATQRGVNKSNNQAGSGRNVAAGYEHAALPALLGIQADLPIEPAVVRLEQAFHEQFADKLRERIRSRYPQMSQAEFDWKLLELKRYFLMAAVLKDVPMFSPQVDDLWHEMLMFTREYSRFGESFIGEQIHHAPHSGGQPNPGGRAWFDWVYAQLFVPTPYSARIWQPFFRHPLNPDLLDELKSGNERNLTVNLFNRPAADKYPEIRETVLLLIRNAKEQAWAASSGSRYSAERPAYESAGYMPYLAGALMFYSVSEFTDFDSAMEEYYAEEELEAEQRERESGSGSSCGSGSGSGLWSSDDNYSGGDGDGSENSGSDGSGSNSSCNSGGSSSNCSSGSSSNCSSGSSSSCSSGSSSSCSSGSSSSCSSGSSSGSSSSCSSGSSSSCGGGGD